ncbi:MAG: hypothetical protein PF508_00915 [Spirochaeta sp.]|jgi:5'-nucleotidase|nr:hypothetical protein [Spirochaeta sp.]
MNTTHGGGDAPLILVTNDDGIASPGLIAAVEAARTLGNVIVAAPTTQQTARGRSLVGEAGDQFHEIELALPPVDGGAGSGAGGAASIGSVRAWHIAASPALVVRHALATLFRDRYPDLVISGINYGENLGNNIMISGTVGAAFQAAAQGVPALAMSLETDIAHHFSYEELDWVAAARVTRSWAERLLAATFAGPYHPPDGRVPRDGSQNHPAAALPFDVLKVDVPAVCPPGTEERLTRLSQRHYFLSFMDDPGPESPLGSAKTQIDVDPTGLDRDDDIYAIAVDRVVSVTPLRLDNSAPLDAARGVLFPA